MPPPPLVFMYSGQGAQYPGMGRSLFMEEEIFRTAMLACDAVARPRLGSSLTSVLYEGPPAQALDDLVYSHPALFAVQYALSQLVLSWGVVPTTLLGYSLGELVAQTVAGALSLEEGLTLAIAHARLVAERSPEALMMAILGGPALREELQRRGGECWPAAYNFDRHFVVTGRPQVVRELQAELLSDCIPCQILPLHRGFHSALIDPLEGPFRELCARPAWKSPRWPVVSASTGTSVERYDGDHCWQVARAPVQFQRTIESLEESPGRVYVDLGPCGTLAAFLKHLLPAAGRARSLSLLGSTGSDAARVRRARDSLTALDAVQPRDVSPHGGYP